MRDANPKVPHRLSRRRAISAGAERGYYMDIRQALQDRSRKWQPTRRN
jgi:hypothetical protein